MKDIPSSKDLMIQAASDLDQGIVRNVLVNDSRQKVEHHLGALLELLASTSELLGGSQDAVDEMYTHGRAAGIDFRNARDKTRQAIGYSEEEQYVKQRHRLDALEELQYANADRTEDIQTAVTSLRAKLEDVIADVTILSVHMDVLGNDLTAACQDASMTRAFNIATANKL